MFIGISNEKFTCKQGHWQKNFQGGGSTKKGPKNSKKTKNSTIKP